MKNGAFTIQMLMLAVLYVFLYTPIFYVIYVSFQANSVWPFPPELTLEHFRRLMESRDFHSGFINSLSIGMGTGMLSCTFATMAAIGILRYRTRFRGVITMLYLSPLFIAHVLIGISSLMFNRTLLGLPGNVSSAILANTTYATAFAFLVVLAQLARYDWRYDEVAMVFGARPHQTFRHVTLPLIWPAMLGAFIVSFLLAFNNLEISFYNLGAVPTLPTLAWGSLRHGISEELYALASVINVVVFIFFAVLYALMRAGILRVEYRD